jgi:O-antigen/teichoic acid export membrane protein
MSESNKLLCGTVVLTVGRVAGYSLSFLRNLILARILAKADYGLAAVLGMAMTLLEISGRMAFGMQVVQSKQGDTLRFQACAHALQFIGGLCSALLIAGLSIPMARLFGVGHAWRAFALLAIVPLCQGLSHLDVSRRQRALDFLPLMMVDVVPQLLITIAAWPLAVWLRDYRVIVWLMVGKALLGTAMTFAFAQRPYRWSWEREYLRNMLSFGWPLLLTGLAMFGSQQADQMIIGAVFSLDLLASYALAYSIVSIPWFIFSQVGASLMLPLLARVQDDSVGLCRQYRLCLQTAASIGVIFYLPLTVSGEQLVTLLFGAKYEGAGVFVAVLGAVFAVRFLRFSASYAAAAKADTINQLYSYLWRGISLPLALGVVAVGGNPLQIAGCAVVGEILAAVYSLFRLQWRQGVSFRESYTASIYLCTWVTLGVGFALLGGAHLHFGWVVLVAIGATLIAIGAAWFMFPEVFRLVIHAVRRDLTLKVEQPVTL